MKIGLEEMYYNGFQKKNADEKAKEAYKQRIKEISDNWMKMYEPSFNGLRYVITYMTQYDLDWFSVRDPKQKNGDLFLAEFMFNQIKPTEDTVKFEELPENMRNILSANIQNAEKITFEFTVKSDIGYYEMEIYLQQN